MDDSGTNCGAWNSFAMPRYFFDVHDFSARMDEVGEELPNDEAAWREATTTAGEMFKDVNGKMQPGQDWELDVADQDRNPLFLIHISTKKLK